MISLPNLQDNINNIRFTSIQIGILCGASAYKELEDTINKAQETTKFTCPVGHKRIFGCCLMLNKYADPNSLELIRLE